MSILFPISMAILASFSWGLNSHLVKQGMKGESAYLGLVYRTLVTLPLLFLIIYSLNGVESLKIYYNFKTMGMIFISSVLIVIGDVLFMKGLTKYPINKLLPVTSVYPMITTFILLIRGEENITKFILLGSVIIIIGVSLVTSGKDGLKNINTNILLTGLTSATCWGTSVYIVKLVLLTPSSTTFGVNLFRFSFIGIIGLLIFTFERNNKSDLRTNKEKNRSMKFLMGSGIAGWVVGASAFFYSVQTIGAAIATPISSTNPIIATIIGSILGIEKVSLKDLIGILLCVGGTIIIVI